MINHSPLIKTEVLRNIHEYTEALSREFNNPVNLFNESFELLSYSSNFVDVKQDSTRMKTILQKKIPRDIIQHLEKEGILQRLKTDEDAVKIAAVPELQLSDRVVIGVKKRGKVLGYISVQENLNTLHKQEYVLLKEFAGKLAELLWEKPNSGIIEEGKKKLFSDLIKGNYQSESLLKIDMEFYDFELPGAFSIGIFECPYISKDKLNRLVKKYMKMSFCIQQDESMIALFDQDDTCETKLEHLARETEQKIKSAHYSTGNKTLFIGFGREYSNFSGIKNSYEEAQEVIRLGKTYRKNDSHFPITFESLGIYRLFGAIKKQNEKDRYVNTELLKLAKYDHEHQADLTVTLESYLKNNCVIKDTAEQLFIHPNTLKYRLNKMNEIINVNLDLFEQRMMIYMDLLQFNIEKPAFLSTIDKKEE